MSACFTGARVAMPVSLPASTRDTAACTCGSMVSTSATFTFTVVIGATLATGAETGDSAMLSVSVSG